jgi:hypothetical protein
MAAVVPAAGGPSSNPVPLLPNGRLPTFASLLAATIYADALKKADLASLDRAGMEKLAQQAARAAELFVDYL